MQPHPPSEHKPRRSRASSTAGASKRARQAASLSSELRREDVLDLFRRHLEAGRVTSAQQLIAAAARRFPRDAEIAKTDRVLNQWSVSSSPAVGANPEEAFAWLESPPIEVSGKWVALSGSDLVGIAATLPELMESIRSQKLEQPPWVHHFES